MQNSRLSLKPYNTFGIECYTNTWMDIREEAQLEELKNLDPANLLILGGGSNILFTKEEIPHTVILNNLKGIEVLQKNDQNVTIRVQSGEVWDDLVKYSIEQNWGGLQNLSLIPGTVGAAPMQNIGAYGVEVKNVIQRVHFLDLRDFTFKSLEAQDCQFGYRTSLFKTDLKGLAFITAVDFILTKKEHPLETSYGAIQTELEEKGITSPTISDISEVVRKIRQSKLPDPSKIGNAGSFFKNPTISKELFLTLPNSGEMPSYDVGNNQVKIPAGWLIEKSGWKGYREGDIGVSPKQALVLVNYGNGKGEDIFTLSEKIITSVQDNFSISLEREVNIL